MTAATKWVTDLAATSAVKASAAGQTAGANAVSTGSRPAASDGPSATVPSAPAHPTFTVTTTVSREVPPAGPARGSTATTSPGTTVLIAAIIAAIATLLVAVLTQTLTGRREHKSRSYERVRAGLDAAQQACSELRNRLRAYGIRLRRDRGAFTAEMISAQQELDVALQNVEVSSRRIDPVAVNVIDEWILAARVHFISADEVSATAEQQLWDAVVTVLGAALSDADAIVRPLPEVSELDRQRHQEAANKHRKAAKAADKKAEKLVKRAGKRRGGAGSSGPSA